MLNLYPTKNIEDKCSSLEVEGIFVQDSATFPKVKGNDVLALRHKGLRTVRLYIPEHSPFCVVTDYNYYLFIICVVFLDSQYS